MLCDEGSVIHVLDPGRRRQERMSRCGLISRTGDILASLLVDNESWCASSQLLTSLLQVIYEMFDIESDGLLTFYYAETTNNVFHGRRRRTSQVAPSGQMISGQEKTVTPSLITRPCRHYERAK